MSKIENMPMPPVRNCPDICFVHVYVMSTRLSICQTIPQCQIAPSYCLLGDQQHSKANCCHPLTTPLQTQLWHGIWIVGIIPASDILCFWYHVDICKPVDMPCYSYYAKHVHVYESLRFRCPIVRSASWYVGIGNLLELFFFLEIHGNDAFRLFTEQTLISAHMCW